MKARQCARPPDFPVTSHRLRDSIILAIALSSATACPDGPTPPPLVTMISVNVSNYSPHVGDVVYVTGVAENAQGVPVIGVQCSDESQAQTIAAVNDRLTGAVAAVSPGTAVIRITCGNLFTTVTLTVLAVSYNGAYNGSISGTDQPINGGAINPVNSNLTITVAGGQIVATGNAGFIVAIVPAVAIPNSNITGESSMVTWTANNIILTGVFHSGTALGNTASGTWQFAAASGFRGGGTWQASTGAGN